MKAPSTTLTLLLLAVSVSAADLKTWSRYQGIIDRAPFGPIYNEDDPAFNAPQEVAPEVPVEEGPKLSDFIKVSAITVYGGTPAAGFTDTAEGKSYYLYQGKSAGDYTLLEVHATTKSILLRKGEQEEEVFVGGNPSEQPAAPSAADTGIRAVPQTGRTPGYLDRQKQRAEELRQKAREEARLKAEEEKKKREEELSKMTAEEREKQLRDYNMKLIITGDGPPLPIELNREELTKLGEEGFDVAEALQALDERDTMTPANRREKVQRMREEARARREAEAAEQQ